MNDFFKTYWLDLLLVVIFICLLAFSYKRGKKKFVKQVVLSLVIQAEKALGSGTGDLKYNLVVTNIYKVLPFILRLLITEKELDKLIQDAVDYLKEYLQRDKNLLGYEDEYLKMKSAIEWQN
ncbi:hypothetical protein [Brassicibacter mesophilus]|uniref:hypothetical protein n=1 Tax=Brassicibacter mesophilus TaxID=745119 RepID=UPI003D1C6191